MRQKPETDRAGDATDGLADAVLIHLRQIARAIDLHSRKLANSQQLTVPQALALREIQRRDGVSVGELAHAIGLSGPTVIDILERLERRGLVSRRRSDSDRRRQVVRTTPEGDEALAKAPPLLQERFVDEFGRLEAWEQTLILSCLQRVATMMRADKIDASPVLTSGPIRAEESHER